jgi:biopolymer transport protein ExbD/biopolymer transport protein TolR
MGMSGGGSIDDFNSEINVTPMVDIMLVLLIIFIVITPLLQQGITITLPKEMNNPVEDPNIIKESSVVISITSDGKYYIGKELKSKEELQPFIEKMMQKKQDNERIVYIKSDINVNYGAVVEAINIVRKAKVDKIGLVADKKKGKKAAAPAPAG